VCATWYLRLGSRLEGGTDTADLDLPGVPNCRALSGGWNSDIVLGNVLLAAVNDKGRAAYDIGDPAKPWLLDFVAGAL